MWSKLFGVVAPVAELSPKTWQIYRGKPTDESVELVKIPIGKTAQSFGMEIVQPLNQEPSFFQELLKEDGQVMKI